VLPTSRPGSPDSSRSPKRKGLYSARVDDSDGVKEVMEHTPNVRCFRRVSMPARLGGSSGADDADSDAGSSKSWLSTAVRTEDRFAPGSPTSVLRSPRMASLSPKGSCRSLCSETRSEGGLALQSKEASMMQGKERVRGGPQDVGMPWRQLPGYSPRGTLRETRDRNGSPDQMRRELGGSVQFQYRKSGQCSPRLSASTGMRELLEPVQEQPARAAAPAAASPHEAWLDTVRRRLDARVERQTSGKSEAEEGRALHWQFRQQRKSTGTMHSAREGCPYTRDDVPTAGRQLQTPTRRRALSPQGSLAGTGASPTSRGGGSPLSDASFCDNASAEKVVERRRDYRYIQAQSEEGCSSPGLRAGDHERSSLSLSSFRSCASPRSFGASTTSALEYPVHSVRPRPATALQQRPSWR